MYGDTVLNYKLPARPAWFINVLMMMMLAAVNNQVVINVQLLFFYRDVYIEKFISYIFWSDDKKTKKKHCFFFLNQTKKTMV